MKREDAIWILELIRNRDARTDAEKDAVNAAIEALKAQLSCGGTTEGTTSDLISRQAARHALCKAVHKGEDIPCENQTASCLWTGTRVCDFVREIDALPPVQPEVLACGNGELVAKPEPTDIDAKEAVYNLAEKIGIHQLFALTVELRGEPIQPEPHEGEWEQVSAQRYFMSASYFYRCSACGVNNVRNTNYCPNCGAKMTISTK